MEIIKLGILYFLLSSHTSWGGFLIFSLMHMFVSDIKKEGVIDHLVLFSMIRKSFFKLLFLILPMFLHKGRILLYFFYIHNPNSGLSNDNFWGI